MTVALVRHVDRNIDGGETITLTGGDPTVGNYLVLWLAERDTDGDPTTPPGFTSVEPAVRTGTDASKNRWGKLFYRVVQTGDDASYSTQGWVSCMASLSEWSGVAGVYSQISESDLAAASTQTVSITAPGDGRDVVMIGAFVVGSTTPFSGGDGATPLTPTAGVTELHDMRNGGNASPRSWLGYKIVSSASGAQTVSATQDDATGRVYGRVGLMLVGPAPSLAPVADFTADAFSVAEGGTVNFTDLSTNTPTSWSWDFGDGGTSTSQHPSHVYATGGDYTVSLTATNANGSDTETKIAYISVSFGEEFVPPPPAGVLLEIYAAEPGSARWDQANWDEAVWSQAGWQDVTPEGIEVRIAWGSRRPELGILHRPEAADWSVSFFDPQRRLDPANADSPFVTDLIPFLPIRVSHRGTIVRVGYATGIQHSYQDDMENGFIRATDNVSRLANAMVPSDTSLSNTLYARAEDAIAAAGLTVRVLAPVGTDPTVDTWATGINDWSAWQWITDAAEQVNHIPIIDRNGDLSFRAWAAPLTRGRSLDSPELVDLQVISDYSGQFSVVQAMDDTGPPGTLVERALTPPPRYGARTYTRSDPTINAGDWADAVLADRALPGLRWVPGTVFPLTAGSTEAFATIEAVELVSMALPEQDPPVSATAIIVGGTIAVRGKRAAEATWAFTFEAAQTAVEPLIETGGGPTDYLLATGGDQFLYPTT